MYAYAYITQSVGEVPEVYSWAANDKTFKFQQCRVASIVAGVDFGLDGIARRPSLCGH